jgi:peptide/nickel transport system permease protein
MTLTFDPASTAPGAPAAPRRWRLVARRLARRKAAVVSLAILVVLAVACFGADWIAPYERNRQNLALGPTAPSGDHWLGTDLLGRDYLTELLYAGRLSLKIGLAVAVVSTALGTLVGAIAGLKGRWVDAVLSRITDLFLVVPSIVVLAIALSYVREQRELLWWDVGDRVLGYRIQIDTPMILILAFVFWMPIARIVRGQVLSLREREFVEAARAVGASGTRIVVHHVLPNVVGVVMVNATLATAYAIVAESTLSFLGFGVQLPQNSWGRMLSDAQGTIGTGQVYLLYFPGLLLLVTILAVNFLGDALRDALEPEARG